MVLIGLGNAGCKIVNKFSDSHKKITIDAGSELSKCSSPELYEQEVQKHDNLLDFEEEECYFFVCGAGKVSAATLALLETIKDKKINLVYIYPEEIMLSPMQQKLNKVAFNVLQEYARSGLIHSMYLMCNETIGDLLPYITIENIFEHTNDAIVNVFENLIFYLDQNPILGSHHDPKEISRIRTVEYGEFQGDQKNLYFPLDNATETCYINIVSDEDMKNNKNLLSQIKQKIIDDKENNILSSFVVFKSDHEGSFYYAIRFTHYLQKK
jgi:hypothetical protein